MAEFLLEIFSEEIPARMQRRAAEDLRALIADGLKAQRLSFDSARAFVTPRRLCVVVDGLPVAQPDVTEERRGPRVGAPEQAMQGFLRSVGLAEDQLEQREVKGSTFWFAVIGREGRPTVDVLRDLIDQVLTRLPWPKSMRAGWGELRWVRPLHQVLALFAGLPLGGRMHGVPLVDHTFGHRFMAPGQFTVSGFANYRDKLKAAKVVLDSEERATMIAAQARALAEAEGLSVDLDAGLLAENAGLVEWPVVLTGRIDDAFMRVPPEVLRTTMAANQKYLTLRNADGSMAPRFILVSNIDALDEGGSVVAGNERVLRARLSDAAFFWDQDRRHSLESRLHALNDIVFHARLGTVGDKVERIAALAGVVASCVPGADVASCRLAGRLSKADLTTGVVSEFPELQGVMGRYYALNDGLPMAIADAIRDHYLPVGASDDCPYAPTSIAVALADKIDTLVGFWAIGETPTGSKDPFALRRAALGIIRTILDNQIRLSLVDQFCVAFQNFVSITERVMLAYKESGFPPERRKYEFDLKKLDIIAGDYDYILVGKTRSFTVPGGGSLIESEFAGRLRPFREFCDELLAFFADRLKVHLKAEGVPHDHIGAVFARTADDDLVRLMARVRALGAFLAGEDGANLLVAYRRAANILRIEEKKDGRTYDAPADSDLFAEAETRALKSALDSANEAVARAVAAEDFAGAMGALATLRPPVDAFFDAVTVNVEDADQRANRLRLLAEIRDAMDGVADFSRIAG